MKDSECGGLSIVLPIFNETGVIEKTILDIYACASRLAEDLEIIAVNDGSTDETQAILGRIRLSLPNLRVIAHKKTPDMERRLSPV